MDESSKTENGTAKTRLNLDKPRYDQSTYWGRAQHFFITTNPLNLLVPKSKLLSARQVVQDYKRGKDLQFTDEEIWMHKHLYDSAFHPETGELMFVLGRMSAQVPMNMLITGCMMHYRHTMIGIVSWQWINQTFNAVVNYTNSNFQGQVDERLVKSYFAATGGACTTALTLNYFKASFPAIFSRFVPFVAVAAANCINIPIMRSREIQEGIPVYTDDDKLIGTSSVAAKTGIFQVAVSRILMATPTMIVPPLIMHKLERTAAFKKYPFLSAPTTVLLVGLMLTFSTPLCCALFPQQSSIRRDKLEPELQEKLDAERSTTKRAYFNKGL